jgi:hypothetical protein
VNAKVGDQIVVDSDRVDHPPRIGTIKEVLAHEPVRFLVEWDDGHTSIFTPGAGVARIEPRP